MIKNVEQFIDAEEPEDTRTPLEMLEYVVDSLALTYHAQVEVNNLLDIFRERGVSFDS